MVNEYKEGLNGIESKATRNHSIHGLRSASANDQLQSIALPRGGKNNGNRRATRGTCWINAISCNHTYILQAVIRSLSNMSSGDEFGMFFYVSTTYRDI